VSCRFTTGLNRALADAGLGELRRQFGYKTTWYGSKLLVVGRLYPSSKTCFSCGAVKAKLALHERTYHCDACGLAIDRNRNAAINLARLSEHAIGVKRHFIRVGMAAARENPGQVGAGCGLGSLPRGGRGLAARRGGGWPGWVRAARDAGVLWDVSPLKRLAPGP